MLIPDWPAPANVRAAVTTRSGGVSRAPYASFNLAAHVGDDLRHVEENRRILRRQLPLPGEPVWLEQVHGNRVLCADAPQSDRRADAGYSLRPGAVCVVLTADCLPVLFCDRSGSRVAAAHAGWKGLLHGVLQNTVRALASDEPMAWLGPAIGPQAFEVGAEVRDAFLARLPGSVDAFVPHGTGKWLADLYALARLALSEAGVTRIYGGGLCSHGDAERFYSYRREQTTGRMASLIWLEQPALSNRLCSNDKTASAVS